MAAMARKDAQNLSPRINNRRALHDYHIDAKLECGMALKGTEVKSLRMGLAQLHEAFARIENGELWLYGLHIDPYKQAAMHFNHEPARSRKLLVHKREIKRLADATREKGTTLIPLAIFFNDAGIAKMELAVGRGKQQHDKRASIKKKEQDRDLRRLTTRRQ
jgi:SsrA-binding protein